MFLAVFVLPTSCLQSSFNIDLLAFGQMRLADFGEVAPGHDIKPLGFFTAMPFSRCPASACGDAETGNWSAAGCIAHFWLSPHMTDNHDFVQPAAHYYSLKTTLNLMEDGPNLGEREDNAGLSATT